jgi:hypothetical protein
METAQGIPLYRYLSLKLAKPLFFFLTSMFFLQQNQQTRVEQVLPRGVGGRGQIMYTHVSKYKNDKIRIKKNSKESNKT